VGLTIVKIRDNISTSRFKIRIIKKWTRKVFLIEKKRAIAIN